MQRLYVHTAVANTAPQTPNSIQYNNKIVKNRVPYVMVSHRKPVHIIIGSVVISSEENTFQFV